MMHARKRRLSIVSGASTRRAQIGRLADRQGRVHRYLRLSVTDRCNFACAYCMPDGGEASYSSRDELLSFEEIERVISAFVARGIERVRFTGGEPFVRRRFIELVERIGSRFQSDLELALSTNATMLERHLPRLWSAGLRQINISIDTLKHERFLRLTHGDLDKVLRAIEEACSMGFEVKLNIVPMRKSNDSNGRCIDNSDEWAKLVRYSWDIGATPRFIELMPLGAGRQLQSARATTQMVQKALSQLGEFEPTESTFGGPRGPANYWQHSATGKRVGFISPITENFCEGCNRVRVSAQGRLHPCLGDTGGVSLRDVIRSGQSATELARAIALALDGKYERHDFHVDHGRYEGVAMSQIGG